VNRKGLIMAEDDNANEFVSGICLTCKKEKVAYMGASQCFSCAEKEVEATKRVLSDMLSPVQISALERYEDALLKKASMIIIMS